MVLPVALKDDILKHTILIQRLVPKAVKTLVADIKNKTNKAELLLEQFISYEIKFNNNLMKKHNIQPGNTKIKLADVMIKVDKYQPPIKLKTAITDFKRSKKRQIKQIERDNVTKDLNKKDGAKVIKDFTEGLIAYQVYALYKSSLNTISNSVRVYGAGSWEWIATLDNTCQYCEDLHETIHEIGDEEPPAHINCNCVAVPIYE